MKRPQIDKYSAVLICLLAALYLFIGIELLRPRPRTSIVRPRTTATGDLWKRSRLRDRIATVRLHDVPLEAAIAQLRSQTGATIDVNWKALQSAGVSRQTPVSAQLADVELATALRVILNATNRDLQLGVLNGGTIVVNNTALPSLVVYDLRETIPPPLEVSAAPPAIAPIVPAGIGPGGGWSAFSGTPPPPLIGAPSEAEGGFAETISHFLVVSPAGFRDNPQDARVEIWAHRLIVVGSPEMHRDVENILRQVRETDRK
jgi:hypothetical protein